MREARETLAALEQEQRERFAPTPEAPKTPAQEYVAALDRARSKTVSIDAAGWLR